MHGAPHPHARALARFLRTDVDGDEPGVPSLGALCRAGAICGTDDGVAQLEVVEVRVEAPRCDEHEARWRGRPYAATVRGVVRLMIWEPATDDAPKTIRDIKEQELYFGELPLLTSAGAWFDGAVERAPLFRLREAPGLRRGAVDGAPALRVTPQVGEALTLWFAPRRTLQARLGDVDIPGARLLGALGVDPKSLGLRGSRETLPRAEAALARSELERALLRGAAWHLGALGATGLAHALSQPASPPAQGLDAQRLVDAITALRDSRHIEPLSWDQQLVAVDDAYAQATLPAMAHAMMRAKQRLDRVHARGDVGLAMPSDLFHARPLSSAWWQMVRRSLYAEPLHTLSAVARAAQVWRARVDPDAQSALSQGLFARWLRREGPELAQVSPDTPRREDSTLAHPPGDSRTRVARAVGADGAPALRQAWPLERPDPTPQIDAAELPSLLRDGARVTAPCAGVVALAGDRRVWIRDARDDARAVPLRPRQEERAAPAGRGELAVSAGDRVAEGDALVHGAGVVEGALALGRRCRVVFDATLPAGTARASSAMRQAFAATRAVTVDATMRDTKYGVETFAAPSPGALGDEGRHLDASGVVTAGAAVAAGDVLVARSTPRPATDPASGAAVVIEAPSSVVAPCDAVVRAVSMVARRGVELGARHEALVTAAKADIDDERAEAASLGDGVAAAHEARLADEDYGTGRGIDLPPGVRQRVTITLEARVLLDAGAVDAALDGRSWVVRGIDDGDVTYDLALWGVGAPCELYLLRLGEAMPGPRPRPRRRAAPTTEHRPRSKVAGGAAVSPPGDSTPP